MDKKRLIDKKKLIICILSIALVLSNVWISFAEGEEGEAIPEEEILYEEPNEGEETYEEEVPYEDETLYEEPTYEDETVYEEYDDTEGIYYEDYIEEETESGDESDEAESSSSDSSSESSDDNSGDSSNSDGSPSVSSKSAVIYCRNTGESVYTKAETTKVTPNGITKLFTALIAVQKLKLSTEVTISNTAAGQSGTTMGLKEGEVLTVEQLLHGVLMVSANDAAYALAEAVSESGDAFVDLMNETAQDLGLKNTKFSNVTGYSNDVSSQYTTADDMLEISKIAFSNGTISDFAKATEYEIPETENCTAKSLTNSNTLVSEGENGFVSGLAGVYDSKSASLVMNWESKGLQFIAVVLGGTESGIYTDAESLVEYAKSTVKGITVAKAGTEVGKARIKHGEKTRISVYTAEDCICYLPKQGSKDLINTEIVINTDAEAPISEGDVIGTYQVYVADELATEVNLIAMEEVATGWLPSYIGISNRDTIIILAVIALIVLFLIIRAINKVRYRRKKKKRRKEMIMELARRQLEEEKKNRRYPFN